MTKKKKYPRRIPKDITVAKTNDVVEALASATACGEHIERQRIIELLKSGLEEFPQVTIDHVFPKLIETLESIPAPETWISLQKSIIKSGLTSEEYEKELMEKVYGESND